MQVCLCAGRLPQCLQWFYMYGLRHPPSVGFGTFGKSSFVAASAAYSCPVARSFAISSAVAGLFSHTRCPLRLPTHWVSLQVLRSISGTEGWGRACCAVQHMALLQAAAVAAAAVAPDRQAWRRRGCRGRRRRRGWGLGSRPELDMVVRPQRHQLFLPRTVQEPRRRRWTPQIHIVWERISFSTAALCPLAY